MARQPRTVTSVQDQAARGRPPRVVTTTMAAAPRVAANRNVSATRAPPPNSQMVTAHPTVGRRR